MTNKGIINFWLGVILFLAGLCLAASGFIRWLVFGTSGYGYRGGRGLWGQPDFIFIFDRYTWGDIHRWLAIIFLCLVIIHLAIHWRWIITMTKNIFKLTN